MHAVITFVLYMIPAAIVAYLLNCLGSLIVTVFRNRLRTRERRSRSDESQEMILRFLCMALRFSVLILAFSLFRNSALKMIAIATGFVLVVKIQMISMHRRARDRGNATVRETLRDSDQTKFDEAKGDA